MKVYELIDELLNKSAGATVWLQIKVDGRTMKFPIDWVHNDLNSQMNVIVVAEDYD